MSRSYDKRTRWEAFWEDYWEKDRLKEIWGLRDVTFWELLATEKQLSLYERLHREEPLNWSKVVRRRMTRVDVPTGGTGIPGWVQAIGMGSTPSSWTRRMMNRPRRKEASRLCQIAKTHPDPDSLIFPLDKRPHAYYW